MLLKYWSILLVVFVYLEYVQTKDIQLTVNETKSDPIKESRSLVEKVKRKYDVPGMTVAVSIDGETVWKEGFGFSDLENQVRCSEDTVMRIASVSKPITSIAAAALWDMGLLDMDKSILEYLPDYPQPKFNGSNVIITPRQLLSCTSGIRHYVKENSDGIEEFQDIEFFNMKHFDTVKDSLQVFDKEPLRFEPGEKFYYSSYGFVVLSAVMEAVSNETFREHMTKYFEKLGLEHTYFDDNDQIINKRSGYYAKDNNGYIIHSPYVDSSSKWAAGGFQSTSEDLVRFGNIVLYSSQASDEKRAFLRSDTVAKLWKPTEQSVAAGSPYGMGFGIVPRKDDKTQKFAANHDGQGSGASSMLYIQPKEGKQPTNSDSPKGIVVAILSNMDAVPVLNDLAIDIVKVFEKM